MPGCAFRDPLNWLSWGGGAGLSPWMPGTAGSLVGVVIYLCLPAMSLFQYIGLTILLFAVGIWLCRHTARALGVHDHPAIVWDEIVGYMVTMTAAPAGWGWVLAGFVLFRLFDIWKPWPIRWLDRYVTGGFGIMIDDLLAAIYAAFLLQITSLFL
ncbi:MAG: phosphatidylglycerophosphatase A [Gammaproteobacteria bacterium]|nr:phosphatidylglycerophosphatase A [Gammaproteobacteria bacterium]